MSGYDWIVYRGWRECAHATRRGERIALCGTVRFDAAEPVISQSRAMLGPSCSTCRRDAGAPVIPGAERRAQFQELVAALDDAVTARRADWQRVRTALDALATTLDAGSSVHTRAGIFLALSGDEFRKRWPFSAAKARRMSCVASEFLDGASA